LAVQQPSTIIHEHPEPRRPTRVVVLGAGGFLGRDLLARLAQTDIETLALSSRELDLSSPNAADELAAILKPTDAVVLLAATKSGLRLDDDGFVANVSMGAAFCNAVKRVGCAHVVYLSSDALYPFMTTAIREDVAPVPTSLYALMHLARETMLRRINDTPVAILRVTQVYGAGDPHGAYGPARMVRSALREGRIVLYGAGPETRDHIHVGDVTSVIVEALTRRSRGTVNVATGRSTSFAALANLVARVCGGAIEIAHEPPRMPVLHRTFDTTALKAAFPDRMDTALETGVAIMVEEERRMAAAGPMSPVPVRSDAVNEPNADWNGLGQSGRSRETRRASSPLCRPVPEPDGSR
jgi:UDP-glucose 4-epimerase